MTEAVNAREATVSVAEPVDASRGGVRAVIGGLFARNAVITGVLIFYVVLATFFWLKVPGFATYGNTVNIISTASVVLIVSLGQALAIISGGFDLSVGGTVPLGAVTFAQLTNNGLVRGDGDGGGRRRGRDGRHRSTRSSSAASGSTR